MKILVIGAAGFINGDMYCDLTYIDDVIEGVSRVIDSALQNLQQN